MSDAAQKSFFLPIGLQITRIRDDRYLGVLTMNALDDPDTFNAQKIGVQNTGSDEVAVEKWLAFIKGHAVDHAKWFGFKCGTNRFGKIRVRR